jgi:hypothetical protein
MSSPMKPSVKQILRSKVDSEEKLILIALRTRANKEGWRKARYSELAKETALTVNTIKNRVAQLEKANILTAIKGKTTKQPIKFITDIGNLMTAKSKKPANEAPSTYSDIFG